MQVFISEQARTLLASAAIMAGVVLVQGNPIGLEADTIDDDVDFFQPVSFKKESARSVFHVDITPAGQLNVALCTDDGEELEGHLTNNGWWMARHDYAGLTPTVTWFEDFEGRRFNEQEA